MNEAIKNKQGELLQVKSDILFHDLFNENEMNTIEWVAMQVLECPYEVIHGKVSVGNIRLPNVHQKERSKYVDLIINFQNEKIIIELNRNFNGNYTRNLLYAFNAIINNYNIGDTNFDIRKKIIRVILVNLNWYKRKSKTNKEVIELPYPSDTIQGSILKIINMNLDYYENVCYNEIVNVDMLGKLLTIKNKEELDTLIQKEKLLRSYRNKLQDLSDDSFYKEKLMNDNIERNLELQDQYFTGLDDGIQQGIEKGLQEGIKQTNRAIVINMYKKHFSIKEISEYTNSTIEEVKEIIDNYNKELNN